MSSLNPPTEQAREDLQQAVGALVEEKPLDWRVEPRRQSSTGSANSSTPLAAAGGSGVVEVSIDPHPVDLGNDHPMGILHLGPAIRRGFVIKAITLLVLQFMASTGIALGIYYADIVFGAPMIVGSFLLTLVALCLINKYRDQYPHNMACLAFITVAIALFMGGSASIFRSYANFQAMIYLMISVICTGFFLVVPVKTENGWELMDVWKASLIGYGIMTLGAIVVQAIFHKDIGELGHFLVVIVFCFCLHLYFTWDLAQLMAHCNPDDYMMGVVAFYADLLVLLFACCSCGMMAAASS